MKNWKQQLLNARNKFRNNNTEHCFKMPKDQFNKLLHKYKQLKPELSHNKQVEYLRLIINESHKTQLISKQTGFYDVYGTPRQLGFLDTKIDDVLLECISRDLL